MKYHSQNDVWYLIGTISFLLKSMKVINNLKYTNYHGGQVWQPLWASLAIVNCNQSGNCQNTLPFWSTLAIARLGTMVQLPYWALSCGSVSRVSMCNRKNGHIWQLPVSAIRLAKISFLCTYPIYFKVFPNFWTSFLFETLFFLLIPFIQIKICHCFKAFSLKSAPSLYIFYEKTKTVRCFTTSIQRSMYFIWSSRLFFLIVLKYMLTCSFNTDCGRIKVQKANYNVFVFTVPPRTIVQ